MNKKKNQSTFYLLTLIIGLITFFFGSVIYSYSPLLIIKLSDSDIFAKVAGTTGEVVSNNTSYADEFQYNDILEVDANPKEGYVFDGWFNEGVRINNDQHYVFNITEDTELKACFVKEENAKEVKKVSVRVNNIVDKLDRSFDIIKIIGEGYYKEGELVTLKYQTDYPNFVQFENWHNLNTGGNYGNVEYSFIMGDTNVELALNFVFLGDQNGLPVVESLSEKISIFSYIKNDETFLAALTSPGYEFTGWINQTNNKIYSEEKEIVITKQEKELLLTTSCEKATYEFNYKSESGIPDEYYISYLSILQFVGYVPMIIFCLIVFFDILKEDGKKFKEKPGKHFMWIGIGIVACYVFNIIVSIIYQMFGDTGSSENQEAIISALQGPASLPMILGTVLVAPLIEEILYRKIFFGFCEETCHFKPAVAIIISVLVFSLIHVVAGGDYIYIFQYIPLASAIVLCYYFSGRNIWVSMGIHFVNNLFAVLSIYALGLLQ